MTSGSGNTAPSLSTSTALFLTWSVLTYLVRLWVKLRRSDNWGFDDSFVSTSLLFALAQAIAVFWAVDHSYGLSWSSLSDGGREAIQKALYAAQLFYCLSIGLTKISTAIFIARMTRDTKNIRVAYGLAVVCGAWSLASTISVAIRGDLSQPWATLDGSQLMFFRWLGIEISGIVVEIMLWSYSILLIWGLHMQLSQRLIIVSIFSCRLGLIPIAAVRLFLLSPAYNPNLDQPALSAGILTQAMIEFAFISASVTCLRPFLRPFHSGYVVGTSDQSRGYGTVNKAREKYYMLSSVRGTDKDGAVQTQSTNVSDHGTPNRFGKSNAQNSFTGSQSQDAIVLDTQGSSDDPSRSRAPDHFEIRPHASSGPEPLIISKTQAWTVSYEENGRRADGG